MGKKPVLAAVNGLAHGGGAEMVFNCDIVVAAAGATFAFPEVKRGVAAVGGALPRAARVLGRMRAMEMVLLGGEVSAERGVEWGFVNKVVGEVDDEGVVAEAVKWAGVIAGNSPDSVIVSREGVVLGAAEGVGDLEATRRVEQGSWREVEKGENMREGVAAFVEKRAPKWKDSKL